MITAVLLWGAFVSCLQVHSIFALPAGFCTETHERETYLLRLLEFRDCLEAGYVFPQWCTHFRQGFGSPYFGYYQPGFFYAASALPKTVRLVHRVAVTAFAFSMVGYWFTFLVVSRHYGLLAGTLAGTTLVLAQYGLTNLCVRGDLSEFSAMNVIPAILYFLDGWLSQPGHSRFAGLAATSGLLVVMHACIALATFAFLALYLTACAFRHRLRGRALVGLAALFLGTGLAAFYWLPVVFEWHLIAVKAAFEGHFHFGNHFTEPLNLVISRASDHMPASLGMSTWGLLVVSLVSVARHWQNVGPQQRRILGMAGGMCVFAVFLMSSLSTPLWHDLPLLYRLQFPWRLLTLVSVGVALLVGCLPQWKSETLRRAIVGWLAVNTCVLSAFDPKRDVKLMPFEEPASASDIEKFHFGPDVQDEWLPRGATIDRRIIYPRTVLAGIGSVVDDYKQRQGILDCNVHTDRASYVDLPHLYFPGWRVTINGTSLAVTPNEDGLIRVALPASCAGRLEARFSATPMRRAGIAISALSLAVLSGVVLVRRIPKPKFLSRIRCNTLVHSRAEHSPPLQSSRQGNGKIPCNSPRTPSPDLEWLNVSVKPKKWAE